MGGPEIQLFMSYLVNERKVAGATYTQALCALLFLYKKALNIDVPWIDGISRPKKPARRSTVLTLQEIELVFSHMEGVYALIARLLDGMCPAARQGCRFPAPRDYDSPRQRW